VLTILETRSRKEFHRSVVRFLWAKRVSVIEICRYLSFISDGVMRMQHIRKWRREFGNCRLNIHEDDSSGRSSTSRTDVKAALVEELILGGGKKRRVATRALSAIMGKWKWLLMNGCECKSPISTPRRNFKSAKVGRMHQCARGLW
jgi:hypothetical protein